jgi:hypothetical protein
MSAYDNYENDTHTPSQNYAIKNWYQWSTNDTALDTDLVAITTDFVYGIDKSRKTGIKKSVKRSLDDVKVRVPQSNTSASSSTVQCPSGKYIKYLI